MGNIIELPRAKELEESVSALRRAAEGGEPEAKCCLGWLMEHGKWVDRDPEGAVELYRQAVMSSVDAHNL